MKKTFTLSLAIAAAASAYAIAPQQAAPVALDSHKMMMLQSAEMVQPMAKMSTKLAPTLNAKNATAKALPEGATGLTHYYANPSSAYFSQNSFSMGGGNYSYPIMVLPAYANNVWANYSYYFDADGKPALATDDFSYAWNYWDFDFYEASSTAEDLEVMNQAYIVKGMMMDAPALTVDNDTVYQYDGAVIYGGKGHIPQYFIDGTGMTNVTETGLRQFDLFSDDIATISRSGSFGSDANKAGSGWDGYTEAGYTNFTVHGMAQAFEKPVAPYALSTITFLAMVECEAGATIDLTFFKIDDEGNLTSEIVAEKTYKFTEAYSTTASGYYYPITVDFTTEDEYGFEVDYQLIDCAMVMVISGYENNTLMSYFDLPVVFHYSDSPSSVVEPGRFYAFASFEDGGNTYAGLYGFPYLFYTDDTRTDLMAATSLNLYVELEYPYLQTCQDLVAGTIVPVQNTYDVSLAAGEYAIYAAYCAGTAEDIVISEYPEWLQVEVADRTQDVNGLNGEYVEIAFAIADDATTVGESCNLVLNYKGYTQTYNITHAAAGVDNVAKDNVEVVAVEYYNIQGQKLNAAPENGIFIQKNIKADGSINNVKVVK